MNILVIKHGALGDIVLAFPAFAAIRKHHPGARITLLTTQPYVAVLAASRWFDSIDVDLTPPIWNLPALRALIQQLQGYDMVYDLQTSSRTTKYYRLAGKPPWSGIARGTEFRHANPKRNTLHTRERLADQLKVAGITELPNPNLSWLTADISRFGLPGTYTILVPGAAAHRPAKRWPVERFAALASALPTPVVIVGAENEQRLARAIRSTVPSAIDLTGLTNLFELAAIIKRAKLAVGNDTGPMHLAALLNVPCLVLFSRESEPSYTAPRMPDGSWPVILRKPNLKDLAVAQVLAALP